MADKKKKRSGMISTNHTVGENRRARFDYHLEQTFEAGIVLTGTEVKSLRLGQCSINEAHIGPKDSEIWMFNSNIPEYQQAGPHLQHAPQRARKLLLKRKEIHKLMGSVNREGYTIIPLRLFFDARGMVKMELALAKGKKLHDKRAAEKDRDWGRQKQQLLRRSQD